MSTALDAVYEELKRLQLEGVDRVFIEDSTMALLKNAIVPEAKSTVVPTHTIDLQSAINSGHKPKAPESKVALNKKNTPIKTPLPQAPNIELPDGDASNQMQWLKEQVENFSMCKRYLKENEKIVFGSGNINADIFLCGEAPDREEAKTGSPFQGKSGELLTKILIAMGLKREAVYMTNLVKWRPEHDKPYGNRPPTQEEMDNCLPFLSAQIKIVQPKVIIALGNATIAGLLGPSPEHKMTSMRGMWQSFEEIPLIFTFQPSYLLLNGTMKSKRMVWEDMLKVMEKIGLPISEKQRNFFLPRS